MSNIIQLFGENYNVSCNYEDLITISELETYLPIVDSDRYNLLKTDIGENGINDPILYYSIADEIKVILDGHSRLKACIELNLIDIPTKEITESFENLEEIQFWIVKNQCQRRNLTPVEKLQLACLHEEVIAKKAKENLAKAGRGDDVGDKVDTILEIAKLADVSRTTVARYRKVLKKGSEKLIGKMIKGDISITSAYTQTQNKRKVNINLETDIKEEIPQELELQSSQPVILNEKYADDINTGRHLLINNEIEYFIVAMDKTNVQDILSQQSNTKYKVFILEN